MLSLVPRGADACHMVESRHDGRVRTFDLDRFVLAQDSGASYVEALRELREGRKRTHWIWWVFPQLAGLGLSDTSRHYAISGLDEARAYLADPVLGPRLREATTAMLEHADRSAREVLGGDDVKLRSCLTLFARAAPDDELFGHAIDIFFAGVGDAQTDRLLGEG
jgi:uncharacterized protein (DUF1810 family)